MTVTAVLFDFNGVIIDDEPLHDEAWRDELTPLGLTYSPEEYYGPLLGVPDSEFLRLLAARRGVPLSAEAAREATARKTVRYAELVRERQVDFAGLPAFLDDLRANGVALAVVSGAIRPEIEWHLARLGLRDRFAALVAAGEYPKPKPDPAPYFTGLAALEAATGQRFDPATVVVVEDSPNGVASGRAAGMPVLGVTARVDAARLPGCFAYVTDFAGLNAARLAAWVNGA